MHGRERIRGRLIYFAARRRSKEKRGGGKGGERERERKRGGSLEAEHGSAVIKEMNGYRGQGIFSLPFFRGMHLPIRNVRPFAPFRSSARGAHIYRVCPADRATHTNYSADPFSRSRARNARSRTLLRPPCENKRSTICNECDEQRSLFARCLNSSQLPCIDCCIAVRLITNASPTDSDVDEG